MMDLYSGGIFGQYARVVLDHPTLARYGVNVVKFVETDC